MALDARRRRRAADRPGRHATSGAVAGGTARWSTPASPPASRRRRDGPPQRAPGPRVGRRRTPSDRRRCPGPRSSGSAPTTLAVGVVLPRDHVPGTPLPVLMSPYGGPHHREVVDSPERWLRGPVDRRPGLRRWSRRTVAAPAAAGRTGTGRSATSSPRSPSRTRCEALHAVAELVPDLDLTRVGIRGWSFGGYLAALAVLRRPDVFHAAVAGAPVTDWRLYDTFYTERYLGHPDEAPEVYDRNSPAGRRAGADPAAAADPRDWPTTTWWWRTRCGCRRPCSRPGGRTTCCRCPASRT